MRKKPSKSVSSEAGGDNVDASPVSQRVKSTEGARYGFSKRFSVSPVPGNALVTRIAMCFVCIFASVGALGCFTSVFEPYATTYDIRVGDDFSGLAVFLTALFSVGMYLVFASARLPKWIPWAAAGAVAVFTGANCMSFYKGIILIINRVFYVYKENGFGSFGKFEVPNVGLANSFAVFTVLLVIGFIVSTLMAFAMAKTGSLVIPAAATLPLLLIGVCFDLAPSHSSFLCLIAAYMVVFSINASCDSYATAGARRAQRRGESVDFGKRRRSYSLPGGGYSSKGKGQQAAGIILSAFVIFGVMSAVCSPATYKKNAVVNQVGIDISDGIQKLKTYLFVEPVQLPFGDLTSAGNVEYTGKTVLKVKTDSELKNPLYLRSYTGGNLIGDTWKELSKTSVAKYDVISNTYDYIGFFFPSSYASLLTFSHKSDEATLSVINVAGDTSRFMTLYNADDSNDFLENVRATSNDGNLIANDIDDTRRYEIDYTFYSWMNLTNDVWPWGDIGALTGEDAQRDFSLAFNGSISFDSMRLSKLAREYQAAEEKYRRYVYMSYSTIPDSVVGKTAQSLADCAIEASGGFPVLAADGSEKYDSLNQSDEKGLYEYYLTVDDETEAYGSYTEEYINFACRSVRNYLADNYTYTLSPGKTPENVENLDYFLNENKKGYCMHFASAATLMLRSLGIPARYCEGYFVYTDALETDKDGYSLVPDNYSHAWVEVYHPGYGWVAVEMTPGFGTSGVREGANSGSTSNDISEYEPSDTPETPDDTITDDNEESPDMPIPVADNSRDNTAIIIICCVAGGLLLLALIMLALRSLTLRRRRKRMLECRDANTVVLRSYRYIRKALVLCGLKKHPGEGYDEFALRCTTAFSDISDCCPDITGLALKAVFSEQGVAPAEAERAALTALEVVPKILSQAGKLRSFFAKYVLFLM